MQRNVSWCIVAMLAGACLSLTNANAMGALDLSWFTVDGGGARSTEVGGLEVHGTIGQPDAGTHTGGRLVLLGGFWDSGWPSTVATQDPATFPPPTLALRSASPNPFTPRTAIRYSLPAELDVRLDVFDIFGRCVVTLVDERLVTGFHTVTWDGTDDGGRRVGSGIYFARLTAGAHTSMMKLAMTR